MVSVGHAACLSRQARLLASRGSEATGGARRVPRTPRPVSTEFKDGFWGTLACIVVGVAIVAFTAYTPPKNADLLPHIGSFLVQGGFGAILGLIGGKFSNGEG